MSAVKICMSGLWMPSKYLFGNHLDNFGLC